MCQVIISGLFGLLGVVIGWILNQMSMTRLSKPQLYFQMCRTPDEDLMEKQSRTKTAASEYSVRIYNMGQKPFILEQFQLVYKDMIITCFIGEKENTVLPYQSVIYTLMEEDADTLKYFCKKYSFEKCKAMAYSVDGKCIISELDISWINLQISIQKRSKSQLYKGGKQL